MAARTVVTKSMLNKVTLARCQTFSGSYYRLENGRGILQAVYFQERQRQYIDSKLSVALQELYPKICVVTDLEERLLAKRKAPDHPLLVYKTGGLESEKTCITIGFPRRKPPIEF